MADDIRDMLEGVNDVGEESNGETTDASTDDDNGSDDSDNSDSKESDGDSDNEETDSESRDESDESEVSDDETESEVDESDSLYQKLKSYDPKLLKAIPELRAVIFREQGYSELFPTIDDAKSAAEAVSVFQNFQKDITNGDSSSILEALKDTSKDSLRDFVAGFTSAVEAVDEKLYFGMLYPEFKKMLRAAEKSGNDIYAKSARNLNHFIFGDTDVSKDVGLKVAAKDDREEKFTKREQELNDRVASNFSSETVDRGARALTRTVTKGLEGIEMSPILQEAIVQKILRKVDKAVTQDKRHMGNISNLWRQAEKDNWNPRWKDSITTAYLSRAKVLLPKIRQEVLAEAKITAKAGTTTNGKIRIPASGIANSGKGKPDPKKFDWNQPDAEKKYLSQ